MANGLSCKLPGCGYSTTFQLSDEMDQFFHVQLLDIHFKVGCVHHGIYNGYGVNLVAKDISAAEREVPVQSKLEDDNISDENKIWLQLGHSSV